MPTVDPKAPHQVLKRLFQERASVESLTQFIRRHPGILMQRDLYGEVPLHTAINTLLSRVLPFDREFFEFLATPETIHALDGFGRSPLHSYCAEAPQLHVEMLLILMGGEPNANLVRQTDISGCTPLHHMRNFSRAAHIPAIQLLVETCPQALAIKNRSGETPLHTACTAKMMHNAHVTEDELILYLASSCPAALRIRSNRRETPLHSYCVYTPRPKVSTIQALLKGYPDGATSLDEDGYTPLERICHQWHLNWDPTSALECLANAYPEALMMRDSKGHTLLHRTLARASPNVDVIRFLVSKCKSLLECNDTGNDGTPLHYLCSSSSFVHCDRALLKYLKLLAISKQAAKARNKHGQTPLHVLCVGNSARGSRDFHDAVQYLLVAYPEALVTEDNQGMTPLELVTSKKKGDHVALTYQLVSFDPVAFVERYSGEYSDCS